MVGTSLVRGFTLPGHRDRIRTAMKCFVTQRAQKMTFQSPVMREGRSLTYTVQVVVPYFYRSINAWHLHWH